MRKQTMENKYRRLKGWSESLAKSCLGKDEVEVPAG